MSQEWFQVIANPYYRSKGYEGVYVEEVAFVPPTKPYFKGNSSIPERHPSEVQRTWIRDHLQSVEPTTDSFIGNTSVSELHSLERENDALRSLILREPSSLFQLGEDGSFECSVETLTLYRSILLPGGSSLFNGDVRSFLRREQTKRFDIVVPISFFPT